MPVSDELVGAVYRLGRRTLDEADAERIAEALEAAHKVEGEGALRELLAAVEAQESLETHRGVPYRLRKDLYAVASRISTQLDR